MPSEFTPRYNLAKPNVNGLETENVWGFDINLNFDKLDQPSSSQRSCLRLSRIRPRRC